MLYFLLIEISNHRTEVSPPVVYIVHTIYINLSDITAVLLDGISGIFLKFSVFVCAVVLIRNLICSSNQGIDFPPTNTGQTFQICLHTQPQIEPCRTKSLLCVGAEKEELKCSSSSSTPTVFSLRRREGQDGFGCFCSLAFD